ncbi:hypothetical protein SAMN02745664_11329 [Moraxella cuniculi DSM 21768]|uniref:Uncharacterized protein n=1 Tax=Moraxella cuniculi DSM 21768 TaxID=1122245 RepID=A0A1N7FIA2_9GAMM|nr:hypothetical protein [Moraxella cuniculi]OOS02257.1 hypothetical protein B0189_10340 [Moraxella cuniculi]SIS00082.1 hypothetical protein SAMN02745664_11329 [Moraxella cuniculi DSM 21768]
MEGGERVRYEVPRLPRFGEYYLHFVMKDEYNNLLSGKNYILYNDKGEIVKTGVLDEEGKTSVLHDNLEKEYYIHVLDGEN